MANQQQTTFTISEAAKLYGIDRTTVFQHTKKKSNGLSTSKEKRGGREVAVIDLAELIRFYGEPSKQQSQQTLDQQKQQPTTSKKGEVEQRDNSIFQVALLEEKLKHQQELLEQERKERERERHERSQERRALEAERDRAIQQVTDWQKQAEISQKLLTDEREKNEPKKRWWQFGR